MTAAADDVLFGDITSHVSENSTVGRKIVLFWRTANAVNKWIGVVVD
jgi:vacuolar-type H+-ATPase catalytic subunit A/Vma1